ncbi:MAG TPA: cation:proton antiporter, partial [Methanocorpusculum sp.]|nr:cation:proton antiporter [Methanocorpusculum sp.]
AMLFGMDFYSAIFIGTALTATSIAITANVLREMGKLHQPFAKAIIGAAVIDDVLSLIVLSVCQDLSATGELAVSGILFMIIKAFGFVIVGALVGVKFIPKLLNWMDGTKIVRKFPEFVFIFAMMIAFFYAMCAEAVGISAIVGAFLAGVCVNRVDLKHSMDIKLGAEYLYIIFASIFFVSLGIIADLRYLQPDMILFIVVLCVVALATKILGCGLPAKFMGMTWKESMMIGVGMTPRGEVAMIVGLIALNHFKELAEAAVNPAEAAELLAIGNELFIAIVVVSLVTTIIVPLIFNGIFFRKERKEAQACAAEIRTHT